ncbi:MAG: 16S rRNA (guanine(527)-N(7))-methyltransferase RsmG [Lachnospiraceae bacterium]|nr:16S rRNA (guanine(527)-N(7))-methyltransferase RsmG [Lachnospiraceae bacterium]
MDELCTYLEQWNIRLTKDQISQFDSYYELLIEWNSFMNLTAITERDEVITKHFTDSLALGHFFSLLEQSVLDLGTGAGFPGIPLKIAFPSLNIVLADSQQKRLRFLDTVIQKLQLKDIRTVHGRAEDLAHRFEFREQFDLCTSRAVANLTTLSEYCIPFVKKNGFFVSYKSDKIDTELNDAAYAIKVLGGAVDHVENFVIPHTDLNRSLIFIKKNQTTPAKYPRKAGTPSKDLLIG